MRMVPLGEIIDINPRLPRGTDPNLAASFIAMADVGEDGSWGISETKTVGELKKGYTYFANDDVVFAKITPCFENGKAAHFSGLPTKVGFGSTEFHVLRPNNNVDGRFLFYAVWNPVFRAHGTWRMSGAVGQKRVTTDFLKKYEIPLPPLSEQKRIAAILDKADAIRRKRKAALDMADEFLRATFLDMFGDPVTNPKGWDVKQLEELCIKVTDGTHQAPKWVNKGIPFLFVSNISNGDISYNTNKFISEECWKELTRTAPIETDDILYTTVGSYGNAARVRHNTLFCFQRHVGHIKPDPQKIHPAFLSKQLQLPSTKWQADKAVRGIAQKTLNLRELKKFNIIIPPFEKQLEFVKRCDQIRKMKKQSMLLITEADTLFASLSQRAFRGEL